MKIFTKTELITMLKNIRDRGWIKNERGKNDGAIGNTLEDLLGIEENNLPIPNASEWELKTSRNGTTALTSLFHMEPSPRALRLVPHLLLPFYGWRHQKAGTKYPDTEMSFRQTIYAKKPSDRGFAVVVDWDEEKVEISFDADAVGEHQADWLAWVAERVGLDELNPQPYWGFSDLTHKAGTKLKNMFFVQATRKRIDGQQYFHYDRAIMLSGFSSKKFIQAIADSQVYIDFDARTGHNHGTKFRIRQNIIPDLYEKQEILFD